MKFLQILALIVWALFYGSYLAKMLLQRADGIQTDRMGRGQKPHRTLIIEVLLKTITYSMAAVQLASILLGRWFTPLIDNPALRYAGVSVSLCGLLCFVIAMATMRDSWRAGVDASQKTKLIDRGIYRLSRNPAFLGFDLFYIGLALAFFNVLHLLFLVAAAAIFHLQIREEEKFLPGLFGDAYLRYRERTARYFLFF